jgi:hypothetical protein
MSDFQCTVRYVIIFATYSCPLLAWKINIRLPVYCKMLLFPIFHIYGINYDSVRYVVIFAI